MMQRPLLAVFGALALVIARCNIAGAGDSLRLDLHTLVDASQRHPDLVLVHRTNDPIVPYAQAKRLDAALRAAGVTSQLETLQDIGHGDGLTAADLLHIRTLSADFLDKHLKPK